MKTDFAAIAELGRLVAPILERQDNMTLEDAFYWLNQKMEEAALATRDFTDMLIIANAMGLLNKRNIIERLKIWWLTRNEANK